MDCNNIYIGQTRREIEVRWDEHMRHRRYKRINESAVAKHMIEHAHQTNFSQLSLLKHVQKANTLDAWESIILHKHRKNQLMNSDLGPMKSKLFELVE